MYVGRSDLKVANKNIAKAFVIILACMNGCVLAILIKETHHKAQPDYLGSCPENCHHLHKVIDLPNLFPHREKPFDLLARRSEQFTEAFD